MIKTKIESGNHYWMQQIAEKIWRVCYISEDSDENLWINVLGVDFNVPLTQLDLEYFEFRHIQNPSKPVLR